MSVFGGKLDSGPYNILLPVENGDNIFLNMFVSCMKALLKTFHPVRSSVLLLNQG
jgi:hypothetical protein